VSRAASSTQFSSGVPTMLLLREGQRAPQIALKAVADNESARGPQLPACGEANRTA
jgi:hypothetical protein